MSHAYDERPRTIPAPGRPRGVKRAHGKLQTRARVLGAARAVFAERGFEAATVRDIADAADVSTGAVFANFADKAELFDAVISADHDIVGQRMQQAAAETPGDVRLVLLAMFRASYGYHLDSPRLVQAGLSHAWTRDQTAEQFMRRTRIRALQPLTDALHAAMRRGELTEGLDIPVAVEMLWVGHLASYRRAVFDGCGLEDLSTRTRVQVDMLLCGYLRC